MWAERRLKRARLRGDTHTLAPGKGITSKATALKIVVRASRPRHMRPL